MSQTKRRKSAVEMFVEETMSSAIGRPLIVSGPLALTPLDVEGGRREFRRSRQCRRCFTIVNDDFSIYHGAF